MEQGTVAFLTLFVICILFLEQNRCKCAEDEVEGHTSIPWWVFLIAGIWVVAMIFNTYRLLKQGGLDQGKLNFFGKFIRVIGGPLTVIFVFLLFIKEIWPTILPRLLDIGGDVGGKYRSFAESWRGGEYTVYGPGKSGIDAVDLSELNTAGHTAAGEPVTAPPRAQTTAQRIEIVNKQAGVSSAFDPDKGFAGAVTQLFQEPGIIAELPPDEAASLSETKSLPGFKPGPLFMPTA